MVRTTSLGSFQDAMRADMDAAGDAEASAAAVADRDLLTGEITATITNDATGESVTLDEAQEAARRAQTEHEYDVEPSGNVANWREYGPGGQAEREPYEPTVHTIADADDQRFSGGGATTSAGAVDDEISRLIPTDGAFMSDRHKAAPELANLAEKLIGEHGFFDVLETCRIDYKWRRKGANSKGKRGIGKLERVSGIWSAYVPYSFVIWLAADTARLAGFTDRQVEAALFHQLLHISQDAKGNWIKIGHDFEGFGTEVRHYGPWTEDLKIGSQAFTTAVQLGLDLDAGEDLEDEEDEDDDEHDLSDLPGGDDVAEGLDDE